MDPKKSFFSQFPKGCPSCGGPRRYITFNTLAKRARRPILSPGVMIVGGSSYFAECEACRDAFVWLEDTRRWVNANEVRKGSRHKATTEKDGEGDRKGEEIDIGKIY